MQNKEIASHFALLGKLLEVHGENVFKTRSYANAAFQIKRLETQLAEMEFAEIGQLKGIGTAIHSKIGELLDKGEMNTLNRYLEQTPQGIVEMLSIKGLGAKKIGQVWRALDVETPGELLYACHENRLALLNGFGAKTQDNFIKAIEYHLASAGLFHFATLENAGHKLLEQIKPLTERAEFSGDFRRSAIILDGIDILISGDQGKLVALLDDPQSHSNEIHGKSKEGYPVRIKNTTTKAFEAIWFSQTGSETHIKQLPSSLKLDAGDEKAIYSSANLSWIPPEMREGIGEIELAAAHKIPALLSDNDIRGVVHNHSTYSDGGSTIESMAAECIKRGYEYLVISDHSKSAVYAGGLTEEAVEKQHREIDELNLKLAPFQIFKSIESDILSDGSLDYSDEILDSFDLVIASVHSGLKMDKTKATERLIKAVSNPYTTIIGHPTGRLLLSREGYPVDHKALIAACAEHEVILELNSNPYRLDADYSWLPEAIDAGVMVSINPDAHSLQGIGDIHYGVLAARKGGLSAEMTWNAMNLEKVQEWLTERTSGRKLVSS